MSNYSNKRKKLQYFHTKITFLHKSEVAKLSNVQLSINQVRVVLCQSICLVRFHNKYWMLFLGTITFQWLVEGIITL